MMKFALLRCCPTSIFLKQYESSTDAVLRKLEVAFMDIKEFNCCGYPLKNIDFKAYVLSSARNLALAHRQGVNILTFCNCCFNTTKHIRQVLNEDAALSREVNDILAKEDLSYDPGVQVMHLFQVLYEEVGLEKIKANLVSGFKDLKIATQYGCHLLRPKDVVEFDDPIAPSIFDQLVEVTGAKSIDWPARLDCCGSPMWGVDDDLSWDLTAKKLDDAGQSGADFICSACVYCQLQFDRVQKMELAKRQGRQPLPSILYTQLLGLGMGIAEEELGIDLNELDAGVIRNYILKEETDQ